MEPNPCASAPQSAQSMGRTWHADGTTRNHTTTPLCFHNHLTLLFKLHGSHRAERVPGKNPQPQQKPSRLSPVVAAQGHLRDPRATQANADRPTGQLIKIMCLRTRTEGQLRVLRQPHMEHVCTHQAAQLETPAGEQGTTPSGSPQLGQGTPAEGRASARPAGRCRSTCPRKPAGLDKLPTAPGPRSTPASPLPRNPLWSCPSSPPSRSSAVTRPKNSQGKNNSKPQTSPTALFGSTGISALPVGAPGTAQPSQGLAQPGRGLALAPLARREFAEPLPARARLRCTNCSLRHASAAAAGAWTSSVASN